MHEVKIKTPPLLPGYILFELYKHLDSLHCIKMLLRFLTDCVTCLHSLKLREEGLETMVISLSTVKQGR